MTGSGAADLLFAHEDGFKQEPAAEGDGDNPEYFEFGFDVTVEDDTLERQLTRLRKVLDPEPVESVEGYAEGGLEISATVSEDTFKEVEQFVFNDSGEGFEPGRPNSIRVYSDLDYLDGTVVRERVGTIPTSFQIDWNGDDTIQYTLGMIYASENTDSSVDVTPSDITRVSEDSSAPFHGFDLSIDAGSVQKLNSSTLSIEGISRFHYANEIEAVDAVINEIEPTLDVSAIISGRDRYELALGGSDATTIEEDMDAVPGEITIDTADGTLSTYDLPRLKPDSISWENIVSGDDDAAESYNMHVNGGISVS